MVLNKIWPHGDSSEKVDVYEVNATTMRFKVSTQKARENILRRGLWNIFGVRMVVSKWTPRIEEETQEEEVIYMWVTWRRFHFICSRGKDSVSLLAQLDSR